MYLILIFLDVFSVSVDTTQAVGSHLRVQPFLSSTRGRTSFPAIAINLNFSYYIKYYLLVINQHP